MRTVRGILLVACLAGLSAAHVGSPDIYVDGNAGPYHLFVTIRPPQVIPGAAEIEIRSQTAGIRSIQASPLPLSGAGSKTAPTPEQLHGTAADSQFFTGTLWLMTDGSWQIKLAVDGERGAGTLAIPIPAIARATLRMQWQLGLILVVLGVFLVGGITAISGAAVREAKLNPGEQPSSQAAQKSRIAMVVSFGIVALVLAGGKMWWDQQAAVFQNRVYKPLNMQATLADGMLRLDLSEPGWMQPTPGTLRRVLFERKMDDLVLDHNHLMHLYIIREPGLDVIYHLHPELVRSDEFSLALPEMPPGRYQLYADVVHADGLPETLTAKLNLPRGLADSRALNGDDAKAQTTPVSDSKLSDTFSLPDGYKMHWIRDNEALRVRQGSEFRFELVTPDGSKPKDMALYMGMLGHAAFVKDDGTVFAHVHPNGTVPMSAFTLAQGNGYMDHGSMHMDGAGIPDQVAFPYGLPSAGRYRIFVQMKHADSVETGVFDATAVK